MFQLDVDQPPDKPLEEWLAMHDVRHFLERTQHGDVAIHYMRSGQTSTSSLFSVLMPRRLAGKDRMEELLAWNFSPLESEWSYCSGRTGSRLLRPFASVRPAIYEKAVPVLTARHNLCFKDRPVYFEVNPQITHLHNLHWLEERSAHCTLDDNGDIREVIKLHVKGYRGHITIAEDVLLRHLLLGDFALIRFFDLDRRIDDVTMPDPSDFARVVYWEDDNIYAKWTPVYAGMSKMSRSYLRGLQIVHAPTDRRAKTFLLSGETIKQYCTYIVHDWKHDRIADVSCDPEKLGNYFVESPHPFETTPAFFRRDVLLKYQNDPEKYTVQDQHVYCRSTWDLRYDVNDEGQVHALLIDLGRLPYTEQLYWKSYNEPPKAGISERAFRAGFLGEWYDEPEPLSDLKHLMASFPQAKIPSGMAQVWQRPSGADADLADRIHYLASGSQKEWESEIVSLDKFIVEGLNLKHLRKVAEQFGVEHQKLASIALLREVLVAAGIATDIVASIVDPLRELQDIRSKVASHRKGEATSAMIKQLRKQHKDLASHHRHLIRTIFESVQLQADLIKRGVFDIS
ncbi:MAG: hypothetical protein M3R24_06590 [Chloroflexota bacterium]|nr:hypothetical protein [Chloroflexota bacterium]